MAKEPQLLKKFFSLSLQILDYFHCTAQLIRLLFTSIGWGLYCISPDAAVKFWNCFPMC